MANNSKFTGWSGTTFDISKLNVSERTQNSTQKNSKIITGPVVIEKTPKNGPSRAQESRPVFITGDTQQSVSNRRSLTSQLGVGVDTPFTAGTVDYSFPAGGGWEQDGFNGAVYHIAQDSNGKYVVGGGFTTYYYNGNSYTSNRLIRLNTDGTVDESFDISNNWDCYGGGFNDTVYSLVLQSDGKILVGGIFSLFDRDGDCNTANSIIRLNSDGSRDLTFNTGNGFNSEVYDIAIQPDGKILVVGDFTQYNGTDAYRIIRLNSNGSIDSSFLIGDTNVSFNEYVNVVKLQSDGKILCGGYFTTYGQSSPNYIVRINSNGTIDTSFNIGNGFNNEVYTIALQSDGKIIVGGYFDYFDNNDLVYGQIVRLDSNGTLDTLFGHGLNNQVHSLAVQSDGKILVGGYFGTYIIDNANVVYVHRLVRFNSDCSFDYSFYFEEDTIFNDGIEYITVLEDDNILVGGFFNNFDGPDPLVYPLNYFGRLHNSISVYPYTYTVVACTQPLIDETITYVVGSMTPLSTDPTYSLQSLQNPSITVCGYIDLDIYPSNVIEYTVVNTYNTCEEAYTSNYKLVLYQDCLGNFSEPPVWVVDNRFEIGDIFYVDSVIQAPEIYFVKFAATIIDVFPWSGGTGPFGPVWEFLPPVNYVTYTSCDEAIETNGVIYEAISCLTPETSYPLIHIPYYDYVTILIPTEDNPVKTIVQYLPIGPYEVISGGTPEIFSTIKIDDGESCILGLSEISPEGILNNYFGNTGFLGDLVYTMVEQPDGKILVGGNFDEYLEVTVGNLMRINPDGSLDETFYLGQFNSYIRAIALQPDGKILVGGDFTDYDGYNVGRFIRLNSDGTNDENFTFSTEFNDTVRAIAVQQDGKIVVGGDFNTYYNFPCPQIVRLNSDGTPDPTFVMGDGFDGDQVFTINIETIRNNPFYNDNGPVTYTENIIVGGWFTWYNGTTVRGIVKLSPTGEVLPDFGEGFNVDTGDNPRVNQILIQPDGKIVVIGGSNNGGELRDYNNTWIPQNIVRLDKDIDGIYQIDNTFTTRNWDDNGGFDGNYEGAALSILLLPNGKYMVGGQFDYYGDNNNDHSNLPYLVRLNSDGTLDETFTFDLDDDYVNKVLLLSSGILLVGGRFETPKDLLLELFIGEEYKLRSFTTCDGITSNIFLPTSYEPESVGGGLITTTELPYSPISTGDLDMIYEDDGGDDDSNFFIELPLDFDVNFLGTNYTSVYVGTNSYITFGAGSDDYGIDPLPGDIPAETGLPGVYISTRNDDGTCLDSSLVRLYTGTTDGGNTTIVRFEGNHNTSTDFPGEVTIIYNYKFYKDQSNYFDLVIEQNNIFCNDDSTGGISNGVDPTWVTSFDTSSEKSYRIYQSSPKQIKANVNERVAVCGTVGEIISTPNLNDGAYINGSMYFNGTDSLVTIDVNNNMDLNFGPWTVEWYQKYTSTDTCCRRVFDIGQNPGEEFGVSIENGDTLILWMASGSTTINLSTPVYNVWSYFAITSENTGGFNQIIRVYQDGTLIYSGTTDVDINNFNSEGDLPLVIGGGSSGTNSLFEGYITNFRWSKGSLYYDGPTMEVPTIPLAPYNASLLFTTVNEAGLLTNDCISGGFIPANEISANNVTWSTETPFVNLYDFSLFTSTNTTSYNTCSDCGQTYQTKLFVRDGVNPDKIETYRMTLNSINNVLTNGPIFTTRGPECYEILKYTY